MVAMREGLASNAPVSFFATDQLGSTTTTLWADGSVRADRRSDPWGADRYTLNTTPTGYRYTNQRQDEMLGLYDYNARYYDPEIGRFISADSIVSGLKRITPLTVGFHETILLEKANKENIQSTLLGASFLWPSSLKRDLGIPQGSQKPQAINRYTYTLNNPLKFVDPSGHEEDEIPIPNPVQIIPEPDTGWYTFRWISLEGDELVARIGSVPQWG